jgi:hypothetical protein
MKKNATIEFFNRLGRLLKLAKKHFEICGS